MICLCPAGSPRGDVSISFTCAPSNKERLVEMALDEVAWLQSSLATAEEVQTLLNLEQLQFENSQQVGGCLVRGPRYSGDGSTTAHPMMT